LEVLELLLLARPDVVQHLQLLRLKKLWQDIEVLADWGLPDRVQLAHAESHLVFYEFVLPELSTLVQVFFGLMDLSIKRLQLTNDINSGGVDIWRHFRSFCRIFRYIIPQRLQKLDLVVDPIENLLQLSYINGHIILVKVLELLHHLSVHQ